VAEPLDLLANPDEAARYLGEHLFRGSLALVLGAGVSKPLGLPTWEELLAACFKEIGVPPSKIPDLELRATDLAEACVRKSRDLKKVVLDCLYPPKGLSPVALMASKRMGALGAMLMGSRRGTVKDVLTFNFDSALEEYLTLHGYVVRIVTELPTLIGSEDVTIFHPHGYLPSKSARGTASDSLIFTKQSILQRTGDHENRWWGVLRELVRSKVLVLIGISEDTAVGNAMGPILQHEADQIAPKRPSAFWIAKRDPRPGFGAVLRDANIVTVAVGANERIDDFLLSICREAAKCMVY
jgi:SIR2-like domain